MSIQSEIARISGAKQNIITSLTNLGIEVPADGKIDELSVEIKTYSENPSGGTYIQTFSASTNLSITAATHGKGANPWVDIYFLEGSNYIKTINYPSSGYKVSINATGDVTITFDTSSSGRVIIGG